MSYHSRRIFLRSLAIMVLGLGALVPLLLHGADRQPEVLPLWPEGAVESKGLPNDEQMVDRGQPGAPDRTVRNVTQLNLEVFRAEKPSGTGVLIMPGCGPTGGPDAPGPPCARAGSRSCWASRRRNCEGGIAPRANFRKTTTEPSP